MNEWDGTVTGVSIAARFRGPTLSGNRSCASSGRREVLTG